MLHPTVFVRLLAVLIALGLLVGSAPAPAQAQAHTPSALVVCVEEVEELDEVGDVVTELATPAESPAVAEHSASHGPPGYRPCRFVFRPPRTYAFN